MSRKPSTPAVVRQFQSETDAIREAPEPWVARVTVLSLTAFLVACVVLMSVTHVDRVISSMGGKIVPLQAVNVFQSLVPALIKTIDVKEGEEVKADQVLATLDATFASADVKLLSSQIASLKATIARDEAELAGKPFVIETSDSDLSKYGMMQKALYDQRQAQYAAQINGFESKILQAQRSIAKYQGDHDRHRQREQIAQKIEEMRTTLAEKGIGSQLNMLVSQDSRLELARMLEFDHNSLLEAQQTLAAVTADRDAFVQQWSTGLSQELVKARTDLDTSRAQLEKAMKYQDLVRLTAAEPSVVLTVAKLSVGSVLKEGDPLFTLMPLNAPVEAEIKIVSRDIGFVRPGDPCTIKIDAFNFIEHGVAEGKVRWISAGSFTQDENGRDVDAYYRARCSIDSAEFRNVPGHYRLIPGMTLTADLNIGTRSVAMYLLSGMLRGFNEAMREP